MLSSNRPKPIPIDASFYPMPEGVRPMPIRIGEVHVLLGEEELRGLAQTTEQLCAQAKAVAIDSLAHYEQVERVVESPGSDDGSLVAEVTIEDISFNAGEGSATVEDLEGVSSGWLSGLFGNTKSSAVHVIVNVKLVQIEGEERSVLASGASIGRCCITQGWQKVTSDKGPSVNTESVVAPASPDDIPEALRLGIAGATTMILPKLEWIGRPIEANAPKPVDSVPASSEAHP